MMRLLRNNRQQCDQQTQGDAKRALNHGTIHIQITGSASKILRKRTQARNWLIEIRKS